MGADVENGLYRLADKIDALVEKVASLLARMDNSDKRDSDLEARVRRVEVNTIKLMTVFTLATGGGMAALKFFG